MIVTMLIAAAAVSPPTGADAVIAALYAPYFRAGAEPAADWHRPVYTRATAALLAQWKRHRPQGYLDPSGLDEAGWFCACQDWDSAAFKVSRLGTTMQGADRAVVTVAVRAGADDPPARIVYHLQREGGAWRIADLSNPAFPEGLVARLKAGRRR